MTCPELGLRDGFPLPEENMVGPQAWKKRGSREKGLRNNKNRTNTACCNMSESKSLVPKNQDEHCPVEVSENEA